MIFIDQNWNAASDGFGPHCKKVETNCFLGDATVVTQLF